ncbi:MAG: hypothetical protein M0R17_05115 [Candidatus Omnitrophica bacterium]|jgi:hypothetical protein|nr:hypothetical protein [Candidatus Omnitrophota bacterium]
MHRFNFEVFFKEIPQLDYQINKLQWKFKDNALNIHTLENIIYSGVGPDLAVRISLKEVKHIHDHICVCDFCPTVVKSKDEILLKSNNLINSMKTNNIILQKIIK